LLEKTQKKHPENRIFPLYGLIGLGLVAIFWPVNWLAGGARTYWAFFPMWLGFCLIMDAVNLWRTNTSLLKRDWRKYIGLFLVSAACWWFFEVLNYRIQNWYYLGRDLLNNWQYFLISTVNFSIVIPAIFASAEFVSSFPFIRNMKKWLIIRPNKTTTSLFFVLGWVMFALLLLWPRYFFALMWLSVYFILEPINVWLGNENLGDWTKSGDWRPVVSLFFGALFTGFFWEMWNYFSFPKWIYTVPYVNFLHIFEMPLLGYGGYLPFACELFAFYHLVTGFLGHKTRGYVHLEGNETSVL
jgi:hypothetical protein